MLSASDRSLPPEAGPRANIDVPPFLDLRAAELTNLLSLFSTIIIQYVFYIYSKLASLVAFNAHRESKPP